MKATLSTKMFSFCDNNDDADARARRNVGSKLGQAANIIKDTVGEQGDMATVSAKNKSHASWILTLLE